jgi:hypothetical protein
MDLGRHAEEQPRREVGRQCGGGLAQFREVQLPGLLLLVGVAFGFRHRQHHAAADVGSLAQSDADRGEEKLAADLEQRHVMALASLRLGAAAFLGGGAHQLDDLLTPLDTGPAPTFGLVTGRASRSSHCRMPASDELPRG